MSAPALDARTEAVQRRLRFETPWWAGGVYRNDDGTWHYPTGREFQGVCKIVDKRAKLVPCIAHPWQLEFDGLLERQRAEGKPMRAIILKARKLGFSTWVAVKFLQRVTQIPYQGAIVTAQDVKTAGVIFTMAQKAYANLPSEAELGLGFNIKPALIGSRFTALGAKFMQFGEPDRKRRMEGRTGESIFEIDTAGSPEAGRGYTPTLLHLSEVARWEGEAASKKMLGQLNAIPYEPETIVVLESTANGHNHFHRRWVSARDGAEDPDTGETYIPLFVPWWRDPRATLPFATEGQRERFVEGVGDTKRFATVAEDEPKLIELYDLTAEQLAWRRMMIRTQHESNVELFKQENPASDDEAFIGSGQTVFSGILIGKAIRAAEAAPEPVKGTLRATDWTERRSRQGTVKVPTGALWLPAEAMEAGEHELEVWEHPRKGDAPLQPEDGPAPPTAASAPDLLAEAAERAEREQARAEPRGPGAYVIGVDVAEGENATLTEGDYSVITVYDHHSHEQVAEHASRMDYDLLPMFLLLIALYYNNATLAVEVNGPGIAVVDPLHKDFRYPRMYRRQRIDRLTKTSERKPGWETNQVTKDAMEVTFAAALRQDTHGLRSIRAARELQTYVIDEKGRHGATYGEHDDRLMANMIAHRVMETQRPPRKGRVLGGRVPDDRITGW